MHSRVVRKQQDRWKKWKITNDAEEDRKSLEGEIISRQSQNNSVKMIQTCSRRIDLAPIDLQQAWRRSAGRVVYVQLIFFNFFYLKLALRRRSRPPPPQTNALRFASFCELLRWPLTLGDHRTLNYLRKSSNNEKQTLILFNCLMCVFFFARQGL